MPIVELGDAEEIIAHYWREYPRPKEVRDVLEDILHDLRDVSQEQ